MNSAPVPFTILSGWLGSGKTTTLNEVLPAIRTRRVAVLVNELGRVAIDTRLIVSQGSDVLELAGGCVCCSVDLRNDLWDGIADVIARSSPDHVVLETTGIAEPSALLAGLRNVDAATRARIVPAGVVVVVDAATLTAQAQAHPEVAAQLATADRVLLRKLDRASPADVAATHVTLDRLAGTAERAAFASDEAGRHALANWLLETRALAMNEQQPPPHRHGQLTAMVFTTTSLILPAALRAQLAALGDSLVRAKGFARLSDGTTAYVEKAGTELSLTPVDSAATLNPTPTELVLIGTDLDEARITRNLMACTSAANG